MGIDFDPDDRTYEAGAKCWACEDSHFSGVTPKYLLATFQGIIACPGVGDPPPNGTYLLTQLAPTPCFWDLSVGALWIIYRTGLPGASDLAIWQGLDRWFYASVVADCVFSFNNWLVCGAGRLGKDGTGVINWGPDIGA